MNLKDILNQVLSQSAFLERDAFASATDPDAIQMVGFANRAAHEIVEYFPWSPLRKSTSITMVDGQLSYDLPDDFDWYLTETMWKSHGARHVVIPTDDRYWAFLKAGNPGSGISYYAKFIDGKLEFAAVSGGDVINFDYTSKNAIKDASGDMKNMFTADTDEWTLPAWSLIMGTKAYWKLEKEMPTGTLDMQDFKSHLKRDVAKFTPAKAIRSGVRNNNIPFAPPIAQDYLW